MKRRFSILAAAVCLLLAAGTQAKAGIGWQYDFTPIGGSNTIVSDNGHSTLTLTNQPLFSAVGNSDVIATHIGVNSTTPDATPDSFKSEPYTIKLLLKDTASGASTTLNFSGMISGLVSAHSANTSNVFNSPIQYLGIHLGHNIYDVFIGPYTGPGPGGGLSGSIGAHINVRSDGGGGGPPSTPEPSSMALAGLGLAFSGLAAWRRRRQMAV
jgi:hypothetical protein